MTTGMLSPLAPPFHPISSMESFQIFNDGIPSLMPLQGDIIRGFSDETLDECFPPSPEEAAELDAVEDFIWTLVQLEMLEEREERVRHDYTILPKRWAVRRELHGRPRAARSTPPVVHLKRSPEDELKLIVYERKLRDFNSEKMEHHHSHKDVINSKRQVMRCNKALNGRPTRPIIQPRKGF
ncbi:hypothetical protein MHU86_21804 [Fragilaria crotonensis]|nr:hypothetical protein MHU86_21804 [Fragilaria crotonensis]